MRLKKGTKVRIKYLSKSGRPMFCNNWWWSVPNIIQIRRDAGATEIYVKGEGWKEWKKWPEA
jgi:hypothetical protein